MNILHIIFGEGKDLNLGQMCARAIVVFIIGLALIKISGRRSFGMQMSFDNVIVILLGAILSRAVTGVSPFFPVIGASFIIVILHRLCAWGGIYNRAFGRIIKGSEIILYENGKINDHNMQKALISLHDLIEGVRENANIDSLDQAKIVYMDRNGKISVVKK